MNLKNRIIAVIAAASIAVPALAVAKHTKHGKGAPSASFKGKLNLVGGIEGKTSDVSIADDDKVITFTVNLNSIKTGMDMRDGHFRSRIVKDKKTATLKVNKDQISGKNGGTANGELTLNGVAKPVKVNWTKKADGDALKVEGTMNIKYTEWYDASPDDEKERRACEMKVCVEPDLEIKATMWVSKE